MPMLKKKLEAVEEYIPFESSSEEDGESDLSEEENIIEDPFKSTEESDFESDDAPEALSFKSAAESQQLFKKQTFEVIKTHEEEKKKKRKELHQQYLSLKEEKKRKIEDKMLPDEVLQNLNDYPMPNVTDSNERINEMDKKDIKADILTKELEEKHGAIMFKCKILAEESKKPRHVPENILNFKDRFLFGGRIRREKNTQDAILKKEKQEARRHKFETS